MKKLVYAAKAYYEKNENFRLFLNILFILLVARFFMLLLMIPYNLYMGTDRGVSFLMNQWDAKRYQFMIDNGYTFPLDTDPQANWAFFPLYVIVCMIVKTVTFGIIDTYWIGMLVSNVCIFIAAFMAVKYFWLIRGKDDGKLIYLIPVLMFAGPYSFYFGSVYTEAMFVMFIVLFFYSCARKRFVAAGFMAAFASATRIVGCLLVFALIVELYLDMTKGMRLVTFGRVKSFCLDMLKMPDRIFAVLICPFGAFCYMTFLRFFCGDVWAYKNVQIAWREDTYFPIIGVLWKACTGQIEPRYTYMGWFCIAMFAIYGYMFYKKYYSQAVFGVVSLLVPLTSHVMSTCRFTVGAFVIYIGVYDILRSCNKHIRNVILVLFGLAEIWLLFMWYNSDCWLM